MDLPTLHSLLEQRTRRTLTVRLNENRHSLLTVVRPRGRPPRISVHRMFLDAPPAVLEAVAEFVVGPSSASRAEIRRFICQNRSEIRVTRAKKALGLIEPAGRHFDLRPVADQLNRRYFDGQLTFEITWGKRPLRPPRSLCHIQLGNYAERLNLIRVHPILDCPLVPRFFLEYIVYHEMVHILVPPEVDRGGRVRHHTRKFHALERKFSDYDRAIQWQTRRIDDLVARYCSRSRRRLARQLFLF